MCPSLTQGTAPTQRCPTSRGDTVLALLLTMVLAQLPRGAAPYEGRYQPVSDLDAQHATRLRRNPPNLRYTVSTKGGQTTFAVGELIEITQSFERTGPPALRLGSVSWDSLEAEFVFEGPAATVDPRAEFAAWSPLGEVGSILGGFPDFDRHYEFRRTLNPRYSFRAPGRYRFFLTSHLPPQAVTSDIVEITIVPAKPQWQARELETTTRDFAEAQDEEAMWQAARRMRLLGTAAAAKTMARLLVASRHGVVAQELRWGLQESPLHRVAWQELESAVMQAPTHAVSPEAVRTLSLLALRVEEESSAPATERTYESRVRRYEDLLARYRSGRPPQ